jgi:hypothetical protein
MPGLLRSLLHRKRRLRSANLLVDVKKFAEETEKSVMKQTYKMITSGAPDEIHELKKGSC